MIRRVALATALLAATGRMAFAAACLPYGAGPVLNGFETTGTACAAGSDFGEWTITPGTVTWNVSAGSFTVIQGSDYGYAAGTFGPPATNQLELSLTTANSTVFNSNKDWTAPSYNYVAVAYFSASSTTNVTLNQIFVNTASATQVQFEAATTLQDPTANWTYLITSLNYARNVGFDTSAMQQIILAAEYSKPGTANLGIAFDDLQLDPTSGTVDTPNPPVPVAQTGATSSGCSAGVTLTWTAQTQSGGDAISGYHIYRSTTGPTGPWLSVKYVTGGPGSGVMSYTDTTLPMSSNEYFIILPYSSTTTNLFGGPSGGTSAFTGCADTSLDPVWVQGDGGVNEAALGAATPTGPVNAVSGCTPTFTNTNTFTFTNTFTPTNTNTPTNTPTHTFTPTNTFTFTNTATNTPTPTDTPTNTATFTNTNTFTNTPTPTVTNTVPVGSTNTFTPTVTNTATNTSTATPTSTASNTPAPPTNTFTPSNTFTPGPPTPTPTPAATQPYVQLYPNPFYPDRGQVSHLGPVPAGETWTVYDIIGKFVYKATTTGNPALDIWYGYNADGMECSTGIYFMVIKGKVYRIGLVRN